MQPRVGVVLPACAYHVVPRPAQRIVGIRHVLSVKELAIARVSTNSGGDSARFAVNGGNKQSALASGALNINSALVAVTVVGAVAVVVAENVLNCVGYEFRVCAHGVRPLLAGLPCSPPMLAVFGGARKLRG